MQTFLPYESFTRSAVSLDDKRLGKQRVETLQIMGALILDRGWVNHPATKMWRGYEMALLHYQYAMCFEWHVIRGYKDTCLRKTMDMFWRAPYLAQDWSWPWWLGNDEFHLSHRSNLIRKDEDFYRPQFPYIPDDLEYAWPSNEEGVLREKNGVLYDTRSP